MPLSLSQTANTANRQIVGQITGSIRNGGVAPVSADVALPIPAPMDGTWLLRLQLDQSGRPVTGTALLMLSNGVGHVLGVQGRVVGPNAVPTLTGATAGQASKAIVILSTPIPIPTPTPI